MKGSKDYFGFEYVTLERWISYYYQQRIIIDAIHEIIANHHSNKLLKILEIGVGNKILSSLLKNHLMNENVNFNYTTVDMDPNLEPDIVGDITKLELSGRYDIIIAFQVLEHVPFEIAKNVIKKLKDVCNYYMIISVPHKSLHLSLSVKIPKSNIKTLLLPTIDIPIKFLPGEEHYWEVGTQGVSYKIFKSFLERHFLIKKDFRNPYLPIHHFFILQKMKK